MIWSEFMSFADFAKSPQSKFHHCEWAKSLFRQKWRLTSKIWTCKFTNYKKRDHGRRNCWHLWCHFPQWPTVHHEQHLHGLGKWLVRGNESFCCFNQFHRAWSLFCEMQYNVAIIFVSRHLCQSAVRNVSLELIRSSRKESQSAATTAYLVQQAKLQI